MKTYHDSDSVATGQSSIKSPDFPAGFAGSAGILGGEPEPPPGGTYEAQPPSSKTGALITIPLVNQFLIDWAAITFKVDDPFEAVRILRLDPSLFIELESGRYGYHKSLRFGNISIYYDGLANMGCHVDMSGQGCRLYESQFDDNPWHDLFVATLDNKGKFSRLDIANDNVDGALDLHKLKSAVLKCEIRSRFKKGNENKEFSFSRNADKPDDGHTLYFGKRSSRVFLRFYDKAAQMGVPFFWNRAEFELKKERAHKVAEFLASGMPVGQLFVGTMNEYLTVINLDDSNISRCTVQEWWLSWLKSTEKIRLTTAKQVKYVEEVMELVKRQYAPSLAMIKTHLGVVSFNEYLHDLLKDGLNRMGMRHEQMLFVSSQGKADNYNDDQADFEERAAIMEYDGGLERKEAEGASRLSLEQEHQP